MNICRELQICTTTMVKLKTENLLGKGRKELSSGQGSCLKTIPLVPSSLVNHSCFSHKGIERPKASVWAYRLTLLGIWRTGISCRISDTRTLDLIPSYYSNEASGTSCPWNPKTPLKCRALVSLKKILCQHKKTKQNMKSAWQVKPAPTVTGFHCQNLTGCQGSVVQLCHSWAFTWKPLSQHSAKTYAHPCLLLLLHNY